MTSERLDYRHTKLEDAQHFVARVANIIPDDWLGISGELHASPQMIERGLVAFGTILTLRGKTPMDTNLGFDSTIYQLDYCTQLGSCPALSGKRPEIVTPFEVAFNKKWPCGIRFEAAGALTGEDTLADIKRASYLKLREGYWGNIEAISGVQARLGRKPSITAGDQLLSSAYAPLAMNLIVPMVGRAIVALTWNPELGGSREQLSEIEKGLVGLDFKL